MANRITTLFDIKYPIIQGGMVWCSGWKLASAVSNNAGLGLLGAGSMHPETLLEHIRKMKQATDKPWGIIFTSAGSPKKWTPLLKSHGITVVHVVSSAVFARKSEEAGVDAVVAEGFEAGGHNGREETTTLTLIPNVVKHCSLPVIAAGGISSGESMLAAMVLGAEGVQIGSRFAVAAESSAHANFKQKVYELEEGDTMLALKKLAPTRLIKNAFYEHIKELEDKGADAETLKTVLGKGRAKKGIFEGDMEEGELEIGQISSMLQREESAENIITDIVTAYEQALKNIEKLSI